MCLARWLETRRRARILEAARTVVCRERLHLTVGRLPAGGCGKNSDVRRALLDLEQAGAEGEAHELGSVLQSQLPHDAGAVGVHRLRADAQELGDLGRAVPLGGERQHLALSRAEAAEGVFRPGVFPLLGVGVLVVVDEHRGGAWSRKISFCTTVRIARVRLSCVLVLVTNPLPPASSTCSSTSSFRWALRTRTFVPPLSPAMRRTASSPPMPGITRSMSTTSGLRDRVFSTASSPVAASPTTRKLDWPSRNARNPARTTQWSSASRIWIGLGTGAGAVGGGLLLTVLLNLTKR